MICKCSSTPFTVISFYSSSIFTNLGYTADQALFASLGYGALQFVFTIPTVFLIDTKGRRTLTLTVRFPSKFTHHMTILVEDVPADVYILACGRPLAFEDGREQRREAGAVGVVSSTSLFLTVDRELDLLFLFEFIDRPTVNHDLSIQFQIRLPVHDLLFARRGPRGVPVLGGGVPDCPARAGDGVGSLHQQRVW